MMKAEGRMMNNGLGKPRPRDRFHLLPAFAVYAGAGLSMG
jgi:hypothetical protein